MMRRTAPAHESTPEPSPDSPPDSTSEQTSDAPSASAVGTDDPAEERPEPDPATGDAAPADAETADAPADTDGDSAAHAFDQLYLRHARSLTRQAYLLCGHRDVAESAVAHAFHLAWERWPEVAVDSDPAGWVRAAAYEYALSPWHQFRPRKGKPGAHPGPPADRELLDALLRLPRTYRSTLLLHDGLGLSLPDTAAETEASTPAAAGRLAHARESVGAHCPELSAAPDGQRGPLLTRRLRELAAAQPVRTTPPPLVRRGSEHTTRRWTRAAVGLTAVVTAATAFSLVTADAPDRPPGKWTEPKITVSPSGSVPSPSASVPTAPPPAAPSGQAAQPGPGEPALRVREAVRRADRAYLPQLRSTNGRVRLEDILAKERAEQRAREEALAKRAEWERAKEEQARQRLRER
ncbi:sigma factor-like helix-turn-helix DNA-binding protein [Streptomyces sp. NPDC048172]|uniref:RNA polymerase sigma factor n=1 Tax=Streptomyces sp. NPDC048172 TaxID=3365505 RepID=UPI003719C53B